MKKFFLIIAAFCVVVLAVIAAQWVIWKSGLGGIYESRPAGDVLVYEIVPHASDSSARVDRETLVESIDARLNANVSHRARVNLLGDGRIEVAVFRSGRAASEQVERILARDGTLEFRILANYQDHESEIEQALADAKAKELRSSTGETVARWIPIRPGETDSFTCDKEIVTRRGELLGGLEVLVMIDPYHVTGKYLHHATPSLDQYGEPAISFKMTPRGGELFGKFTRRNAPVGDFRRRIAIVLDGEVYSAPSVQSEIRDTGQITGNFTMDEIEAIVAVLNAGSLPAKIRKVEGP